MDARQPVLPLPRKIGHKKRLQFWTGIYDDKKACVAFYILTGFNPL